MNHSKVNNSNSNCRFMDAAFTFVASFLHFGLICLFLLSPSIQSSTTASSSAESPNSDSPSSSPPSSHRQFPDFFNESPSPLATQHQFEQHPRRRIYVTRQFPIRYRRAREECTEGEMLQVEGVPLEMLNLMASFSLENEDLKMDEDLGELALGEEVLRLEGTKAEGKNCSAKNLGGKMDEEWRRRKGKGKRKRPTEIKPGMPLEMRALCPFERVVNTDGHRLPKRIPEIRCICNRPPAQNDDEHQIHCEPLYRHIRVLKFEPNCKKFRPALQRISVGCVAAFKSHSSSEFDPKIGRPQNAQIEQAIR